jgi:GT2 family glycosyltransferase
MYLEDIDYGIKINKQNYDVIFNPISELQHIGGASSDSKYNIVLKHWYNSRILLFMKYQTYFTGTILKQLFLLEEKFLKIYHKGNPPVV